MTISCLTTTSLRFEGAHGSSGASLCSVFDRLVHRLRVPLKRLEVSTRWHQRTVTSSVTFIAITSRSFDNYRPGGEIHLQPIVTQHSGAN